MLTRAGWALQVHADCPTRGKVLSCSASTILSCPHQATAPAAGCTERDTADLTSFLSPRGRARSLRLALRSSRLAAPVCCLSPCQLGTVLWGGTRGEGSSFLLSRSLWCSPRPSLLLHDLLPLAGLPGVSYGPLRAGPEWPGVGRQDSPSLGQRRTSRWPAGLSGRGGEVTEGTGSALPFSERLPRANTAGLVSPRALRQRPLQAQHGPRCSLLCPPRLSWAPGSWMCWSVPARPLSLGARPSPSVLCSQVGQFSACLLPAPLPPCPSLLPPPLPRACPHH